MTARKPFFHSVIQSLLRSLVCKSDFKKGSFPQTHSVLTQFIDRRLRQFHGLSDLFLDLLDFFDELTLVAAA